MKSAMVYRVKSPTEREVWGFGVLEYPTVYLEVYEHQERKTPRHGWKPTSSYHRLSLNRYTNVGKRMRDEPEVPADVLDEALDQLRSKITFERWRVS